MNGKLTKPAILLSASIPISFIFKYYFTNYKEKKIIQNSLHYKYIMDFIIQDKQFYNLCGKVEKISKIVIIESSDKFLQYKVFLSGSKGQSYVLVKLNKHEYSDLKEINKKQQFYSLLNRSEKNTYLYVPQNMSDTFILCEETLESIKNNLNNNEIKEKFVDYMNNIYSIEPLISKKTSCSDIENMIKTEKHKYDLPDIKYLRINDDFKFWKINSIILSKDSITHSIRPQTSSKKRGYELEDTYYNKEYITECLKEIELNRLNSLSEVKEKSLISNLKDELIERKQISQNFQIQRRKNVMYFNGCVILTALLIRSFIFPLTKIDILKSNVMISKFKKILDNKNVYTDGLKLIASSYKYNFSKNLFYVKFHLMNNKGVKTVVNSTLEYNKNTSSFLITGNTFKFPNKEYNDIKDYETIVFNTDVIDFPKIEMDNIGYEQYYVKHVYNGKDLNELENMEKEKNKRV